MAAMVIVMMSSGIPIHPIKPSISPAAMIFGTIAARARRTVLNKHHKHQQDCPKDRTEGQDLRLEQALQQVVKKYRHSRNGHLLRVEVKVTGQIVVNLVEQFLAPQRLIRFVEANAEAQLIAIGRQVGPDQRCF